MQSTLDESLEAGLKWLLGLESLTSNNYLIDRQEFDHQANNYFLRL
jgi:hypothetical protein